MSTYAIGDVQGCYQELQALLDLLAFDPSHDTLWFVGDLVNRGPSSLEVLRFVQSLASRAVVVLGNHDLHLLAVYYGVRELQAEDTLQAVLTAPDCDALMAWLRKKPLLHDDKTLRFAMCHAGIAPQWTLQEAHGLAREVEQILASDDPAPLLAHLYGNQPDHWSDNLGGMGRLRLIVNIFTRMRFCYADGRLDLAYKGEIAGKPTDLLPWFDVPNRKNIDRKLVFGHWAALNGKITTPDLFALDTGCVWGNCLTAMRLEDEKRFSVQC